MPGYVRKTPERFYAVIDTETKKIDFVGKPAHISKHYFTCRNAVHSVINEKYKMFGRYIIRIATEKEVKKYFVDPNHNNFDNRLS